MTSWAVFTDTLVSNLLIVFKLYSKVLKKHSSPRSHMHLHIENVILEIPKS